MALKILRNIRNLRNTRTRNHEKSLYGIGDTYHPIRKGGRTVGSGRVAKIIE